MVKKVWWQNSSDVLITHQKSLVSLTRKRKQLSDLLHVCSRDFFSGFAGASFHALSFRWRQWIKPQQQKQGPVPGRPDSKREECSASLCKLSTMLHKWCNLGCHLIPVAIKKSVVVLSSRCAARCWCCFWGGWRPVCGWYVKNVFQHTSEFSLLWPSGFSVTSVLTGLSQIVALRALPDGVLFWHPEQLSQWIQHHRETSSPLLNQPSPAGLPWRIACWCAQEKDLGDFRQNLRILVLLVSSFPISSFYREKTFVL